MAGRTAARASSARKNRRRTGGSIHVFTFQRTNSAHDNTASDMDQAAPRIARLTPSPRGSAPGLIAFSRRFGELELNSEIDPGDPRDEMLAERQ
jgi:hypothetical protein